MLCLLFVSYSGIKIAVKSCAFSPRPEAGGKIGGSGRAMRDAHLSDDEAVAKMGHPVLGHLSQSSMSSAVSISSVSQSA